MDGIRDLLHIPQANPVIAIGVGLCIWAPTTWFIFLRLFPTAEAPRRLWVRVLLLAPGLLLSYLVFNLVVVTTWTWLDTWAFVRIHENFFYSSVPACHLPAARIRLAPFFLFPILGCVFGLLRARKLAA